MRVFNEFSASFALISLIPLTQSHLSRLLSLSYLYNIFIPLSSLYLHCASPPSSWLFFFLSPLTCFVEHGTREEFSTTGSSLTPFDPCSQLGPHARLSLSSSSFSFFFFFSVHPTRGINQTSPIFFYLGKPSLFLT